MLEIIKQGKKPSGEKEILKFKCKSCNSVFKTDEYKTDEFWVVNRGQRRRHRIDCPVCGGYVAIEVWSF